MISGWPVSSFEKASVGMRFVSPEWFWALLLLVALVLAHLLAHRLRPRLVSSELLWRGLAEDQPALRRRLALPISLALLLGLAILTILILTATGPRIVEQTPDPAVAVILDCSPSMGVRTEPGGPPRLQQAAETAKSVLRRAVNCQYRVLILACDEFRTVHAGPGIMRPFEEVLSGVGVAEACRSLSLMVDAGTAFVRARGGGRVVVISDFAGVSGGLSIPDDDRVVVEAIHVGQNASNMAVTSLVISNLPNPDGTFDVIASALNASDEARTVRLSASVDGEPVLHEYLEIKPYESRDWWFPVPSSAGEFLEVRIDPGGALAVDDALLRRLPRKYSIEFEKQNHLSREVRAALSVLQRSCAPLQGEPLPVFLIEDVFPEVLPPRWIFLTGNTKTDISDEMKPGIVLDTTFLDRNMLEPYFPVIVEHSALPPAPLPDDSVPLALAAGIPAIALVERKDSRGVWCGVPLESTDLPGRGYLPMVLSEMLAWLTDSGQPALRSDAMQEHPYLNPVEQAVPIHSPPTNETRSISLKTPLLIFAGILVLGEGARRVVEGR